MDQNIIDRDRSIIIAGDVETLDQFEVLVRETHSIDEIGGYKIGFELGLGYGLPKVVEIARKYTSKILIYDHQKAATDIPETGENFAKVCKKSGIDTVILFPQAGPETEKAWIKYALDAGLKVIVGGRMSHKSYSQSEGGFITDDGAIEIYKIAARLGINDFVVPGNKLDVINLINQIVIKEGAKPIFYSPGFVVQGGKISDINLPRFHPIIGRGIYQSENIREATLKYTKEL